jgi:hypothetical protein
MRHQEPAMSATIIATTSAALTTVATLTVATLPEARDLLSPITEGGSEGLITTASILLSLPMLAIMTVAAMSGRE